MTQRSSTRYLIASGSLFLLLAFLSLACIFIENRDFDFHQLFSQDMIGNTRFQPFLFTIETPYYRCDDTLDIQNGDSTNLAEWVDYFGSSATLNDIKKMIYQSTFTDFGNGKLSDAHLKGSFAGNTCLALLEKSKDQEALSYILYAKEVEPFVIRPADSWDLPQRDTVQMKALIADGLRGLGACHKDFLKLRYAYQLVRLCNYTGDYEQCVRLYDQYIPHNKARSVTRYWAQCTKAGALYKLHRLPEAEYNFAVVFDRCASRRLIAKRGFDWCYELFHKDTTADYGVNATDPSGEMDGSASFDADALLYCKDASEKIPVFALAACQWAIYYHTELLDSIYQYDPHSDMLEWLAVRGLKQMERHTLPFNGNMNQWGFSNYGEGDGIKNLKQRADAFRAFQAFLQKCAGNTSNQHALIWNFFAGYAAFLNHDGNNSLRYMTLAREHGPVTRLLEDEITTVETLVHISQFKKIDAGAEDELVKYYNTVYALHTDTAHTADAHSMFWLVLAAKYHEQNDLVKEAFCKKFSSQGFDIVNAPRYSLIDSMIAFKLKPAKNAMEKKIENFFALDDLYEVKGTGQLSQHHFTEALQTFQKMTRKPYVLPADPFLVHINDCHDCDYELKQTVYYDRMSFVQRMVELENLVNVRSDKQAAYCFEFASGLYNITNFGNAWMATDQGLVTESVHDYERYSLDTDSFFSCERAGYYYKLAGDLSRDREYAAKSYFMAAKCEQNKYYLSSDYEEGNANGRKGKYRTFFHKIKSEYSNTQYYKQAIKECGYFKYFVEQEH